MKLIQYISTHFIPRFWNAGASDNQGQILFNYRRFWFFSIGLRSLVSLLPMVILLMFTYTLENKAIKTENHLQLIRFTSNMRRTITYFFEEHLDALRFTVQEEEIATLKNHEALSYVFKSLQRGFGGFLDLGLINDSGLQINYVGPFDLRNKNYSDQTWFKETTNKGFYLSDVFLGYRNTPHMIMAVKKEVPDGSFYVLRVTIDIKELDSTLSALDLREKSDAFLINHDGLIQTPSKFHGELLKKTTLPIPEYAAHSQITEAVDANGSHVLIGYAFIEKSPYILLLVKQSQAIMQGWYSIRKQINWVFCISVVVTLMIVLSVSTFMINKIYDADQTRLKAMDRLESSGKLISVGRLAVGVAHEINNPLAVIGENAGLIEDIINYKDKYRDDQQLKELIAAVLESVTRCGEITKQLLEFARRFEPTIQPLDVNKVITSALSLLRKEASYRNITVSVDVPGDFPLVHSDHGSLQQILINLFNNAFQAMQDGGRLEMIVAKINDTHVSFAIKDNGCGISREDQKKIFEPFFTTKGVKGGTGLGLSITYRLVQKLGGEISVYSMVGEGTTFTVTLPIMQKDA
ncbi:MAG: two-component sensor histidine kinase [Deltaproteobacteria bacterium]|nr:two-component sensor histidine kinase [Deltaproteobacteria bacterium]